MSAVASARVESLRKMLGAKTVLLPIPRGQKNPVLEAWNKVTLERMADPQYVAALELGNIGVLLGKHSGGLCSIDIDEDVAVEPFLNLNPSLRNSLQTKGSRGANIWVRIKGEFPPLAKLTTEEGKAWGEWRADGGQTVIDGIHPNGNAYVRVVEAPPVEIEFAQIQWPPGLLLPWSKDECDHLDEVYGPPFVISGNRTRINQSHFVGRYACENNVLYEPNEGEFYQYHEGDGLWKKITEDAVKKRLGDRIRSAAEVANAADAKPQVTDALTTGAKNALKGQVEEGGNFIKTPGLIHVENGMLDLYSDPLELKKFLPEYYSRNQIPLEFDPNAKCPRFLDELLRPVLSDEDIDLFQRWCGSLLLGTKHRLPRR